MDSSDLFLGGFLQKALSASLQPHYLTIHIFMKYENQLAAGACAFIVLLNICILLHKFQVKMFPFICHVLMIDFNIFFKMCHSVTFIHISDVSSNTEVTEILSPQLYLFKRKKATQKEKSPHKTH